MPLPPPGGYLSEDEADRQLRRLEREYSEKRDAIMARRNPVTAKQRIEDAVRRDVQHARLRLSKTATCAIPGLYEAAPGE